MINGISITTYNSDPALYGSVIIESIADCMTGISANNITGVVILPASRRLSSAIVKQDTSSNAIAVSYVVQSTNPTLSYTSVSTQLSAAVSGGTFNSILNANAMAVNAVALEGCTSSSVTTQSLAPADDNDDNSSLSTGAIAGIVVGGLVGLGLILALIAYCLFSGKKNAAASGMTSDSTTAHVENPIGNKA